MQASYFGEGIPIASLKSFEQEVDTLISKSVEKVLLAITHPVEVAKIYDAKGQYDALIRLRSQIRNAITEKEKESRGSII